MKMKYAFFGTLALAVCVTPTAMAGNGVEPDAKDYVIDVKGDVLPTSLGELDYPFQAAEKGRSGECELRLEVAETGQAKAYDVVSCSHVSFERAAQAFAKSLSYEPAENSEVRELVVSWSTED